MIIYSKTQKKLFTHTNRKVRIFFKCNILHLFTTYN